MSKLTRTVKANPDEELPETIGMVTSGLEPLLLKWREQNQGVPWGVLIRRSIKSNPEIKKLAGKRYSHLVAA